MRKGFFMLDVREEHIDRITEVFHLILNGKIPQPVELPKDYPENEVKQVVEYVNRFIVEYRAYADILSTLSRGELDFDPPRSKMHILQSFKNLHANLRHLTWKTQQIANGDFTQKVDFMGDFSKAFNSMTQQLQSAFAKIERQNHELLNANKRMKRDLDAAAAVQQTLLPHDLLETDAVTIAWKYCPCDELAGDFLNIFHFNENIVGVYIVDVMGHGVPAALFAVTISRNLSPFVGSDSIVLDSNSTSGLASPVTVLTKLNKMFPSETNKGRFFTLLYGVLDITTGVFRFASAGHPGPIVISSKNKMQEIDVAGHPIGIVENPEFEESTIELNPGERMYLYSDGLLEEKNPSGELFKLDRLQSSLRKNLMRSLEESVKNIVDTVINWHGSKMLSDDISIIGIEIQKDN
jgi:serine phosphatase RsbU (regulator of sigma subunit)